MCTFVAGKKLRGTGNILEARKRIPKKKKKILKGWTIYKVEGGIHAEVLPLGANKRDLWRAIQT